MSEKTKRQVLHETINNLADSATALTDLGYDSAADEARRSMETMQCILRNNTNPKYGGNPEWNGGLIQ